MDPAYHVPDSTDWLNTTLKDFADLENALHCQVCKEFYDTPMITSCSHTFCSKCIRTSLSTDGKCPACRTADQASKLRNNWALQEVVATFQTARPAAIEVAKQEQDARQNRNSRMKRKRTIPDEEDGGSEHAGEGRQTRSKSRRVAASQPATLAPTETQDTDPEDDDFQAEPNDGLVECLLGCGKRMKPEQMDSHLDRCEDEKKAATTRAKSHTPVANPFGSRPSPRQRNARPEERLAELNYSLLKEIGMRKKLEELGIPAWGNKQLMVRRHIEWVNLWNANCDSRQPRTKRELLSELDTWERTQGGRAPGGQASFAANVMKKDFDGAGWASKNKDEFSRLIADAKRKKGVQPSVDSPAKAEDGSGQDAEKPLSNGEKPDGPESSQPQHQAPAPAQSESPFAENFKNATDPKSSQNHRPRLEDVLPDHPSGAETASFPNQPPLPPHSNPPTTHQPPPHAPPLPTDALPTPPEPPTATAAREEHDEPAARSQPRKSSRDEHAANEHTGLPCNLPAHLDPPQASPATAATTTTTTTTTKKVPMFDVPAQALADWDRGGAGGGDGSVGPRQDGSG
ncbi:DNA repair protein rad18 [Hortaea werneckii]|nr:DNA repair protein rad18 [Hortaea werneckii]KAI7104828.1 DNA repair protein rad18 [Hortaea werneckii]KAI7234945.1 DNA repair protein rad18 [Hortaea werneckii]KAI7317404.1 DNA repair protein rad18 [Hortaea werneckii]KAI7369460.1 DNA repair protein rad18 [Hortaea werneckii]